MKDKELRRALKDSGWIREYDSGIGYNTSEAYIQTRINGCVSDQEQLHAMIAALCAHLEIGIKDAPPGARYKVIDKSPEREDLRIARPRPRRK